MNKNRIISLALAVVLLVALALPAFAESSYSGPIGGKTEFTFQKYLLVNKDAVSIPNVTFTFNVTAGSAAPEQGVEAGIAHEFTPVTANFKNTDLAEAKTYSAETDAGKTGLAGITDSQKYIEKSVTISFKDVEFPAPGNYAYTITETPNGNASITDDKNSTKTLIVAVENDSSSDGKLQITNYYLSTSEVKPQKTDGFANTYVTNNLTFTNSVLGNQANFDLYFTYKIELSECVDGTYKVNLGNAEKNPEGNTNEETITVSGQSGTATFYLKSKQGITIENLPKGTKYTITQTAIDGYTVEPSEGKQEGTIEDEAVTETFQNTKAGVVPTGVMLVIAPFVALTIVGGVGAFAIARKRSKETEEE